MSVRKKCTNLDCKDYDIEFLSGPSIESKSLFCPTCFLGKLEVVLDEAHECTVPNHEEELISAEFNLRDIFQR